MSMVQRTPDGLMVVRTDTGTYVDTLAHFAIDFGEAAPSLLPSSTDCTYEPDIRHTYTDGVTIIGGGPVPWTAGDRYISNIAAALASQAARPPPGIVPATIGGASAQLDTQASQNDGGSSP